MRDIKTVDELIEVMHDSPSNKQAVEFSIIQSRLSDPNFSIEAIKDYQPDLYNWISKINREYWERRGEV